jgi:hypothetical protein
MLIRGLWPLAIDFRLLHLLLGVTTDLRTAFRLKSHYLLISFLNSKYLEHQFINIH